MPAFHTRCGNEDASEATVLDISRGRAVSSAQPKMINSIDRNEYLS